MKAAWVPSDERDCYPKKNAVATRFATTWSMRIIVPPGIILDKTLLLGASFRAENKPLWQKPARRRTCPKGKRERDIEATLEWLFRIGGCERSAYVPVVAGGKVFFL